MANEEAKTAGPETTAAVDLSGLNKTVTTAPVALDMGIATTEAISTNYGVTPRHSNDVKFSVKYSSTYKGEKIMPEGEVIVSKESADHFEKLGIGKIVK